MGVTKEQRNMQTSRLWEVMREHFSKELDGAELNSVCKEVIKIANKPRMNQVHDHVSEIIIGIKEVIKDHDLKTKYADIEKSWKKLNKKDREEIHEKTQDHFRREGIGKFILDPDQLPQMLDHAVGSIEIDGKVLRYYGARLHEEEIKETKTGSVKLIKKKYALILENGVIISNTTKPSTLSFEFESKMGLKRNPWAEKSIKKFCQSKMSDRPDNIDNKPIEVSFKMVHELMRKNYQDSMVFEHDEWYDLNALWDQCTYYHDLIEKFLIIKHEGLSGAAKSKGMKVSTYQAFNGRKFLKANPANFFRYRHGNKSMLCIEEAESLFDDTRKGNSGDSEMVEILNGSYEKGNYVPRQDDKDVNVTNEFDPAGFTRIGSIKPIKGALEKRSVTLHMIKAPANDPRGLNDDPKNKDPEYVKTRNLAYLNGLTNYRKYQDALITVDTQGLFNRGWGVSKPIIAMAKCISSELEERMGAFLKRLFEARDDAFADNSWERILAFTMIKLTAKHLSQFFLTNSTLRESFHEALNKLPGQEYTNVSDKKLHDMMKAIGFRDFKGRNGDRTKRGYGGLTAYAVAGIIVRNDIATVEEVVNYVSEVSEVSEYASKIHNHLVEQFSLPDTLGTDRTDRTDRTLRTNGTDEVEIEEVSGKVSGQKPTVQPVKASNPEKSDTSDASDTFQKGYRDTSVQASITGKKISDEPELIRYVKAHPTNNEQGILSRFQKRFLQKMLTEGKLHENPAGTFRITGDIPERHA